MNKKQIIYIILGVIAVAAICWKTGVIDKTSEKEVESTVKMEEIGEQVADQTSESSKEEITEKALEKEEISTEEVSTEEKTEQKTEKPTKKETESGEITDELNKKMGKVVVKFKDGESVRESEINEEMDKLPDQLSERMSLKEIKSFLALKAAFDHVIVAEAKKEGLDQDPDLKAEIEKRKSTVAGMMLLNDKATELMTDQALKAHYDKIWEKSFKGTKEYSLKVITTSDKIAAENIAKMAVDEAKLNEAIEANRSQLKTMDLDNKPEASLPPEIINPVREKGKGAIVGPFSIRGVYMLFFVKNVRDAQKHDFSGKFKEEYKKIAMRDFISQVNNRKYQEQKVKFYDVNGKEVDIEKQSENMKSSAQSKEAPDSQFAVGKLNDETILARIGDTPIHAREVRKFFKLKSLQDDALVMMSQQFNMKLTDVLVYATKLVVDDRLLSKEAKETKYMDTPSVKEKIKELVKVELTRAYLKRHTKVSPEQIKKTYAEFIKAIPEEDKNDHEISMKMVFFPTKAEAEKVLSAINTGQQKFNEVFREKESADKSAIDFKYVTRRAVDPELWSILKRSATGACNQDVIETDGARFGLDGRNYAIIYVGDRRPVTLPSLSNPADKKYFEAMAYKQVAAKFVTTALQQAVVTIFDKSIQEMSADPSYGKMIEAIVSGNG